MYLAIPLRHARQRKWRVVWRLYRDAWPRGGAVRRAIQRSRVLPVAGLAQRISRRYYDGGYLRMAWAQLWRRA
ncbi:MAG TPA: hypothetical protein VFG21_11660 [Xanthomonadaceae bacterium]|nr:hypothetical protein [Xanthomonadaceae bacterium]